MKLARLLERGRRIRVVGFDDGPGDPTVPLAGVVCSGDRMEGLVWGEILRDGALSTDVISRLVLGSKYAEQLHLVLTDGITFGGLDVVDLAVLSERLGLPCVAVMRRPPDREAFVRALRSVDDPEGRIARMEAAGPVHLWEGGAFQVVGEQPEVIRRVLPKTVQQGKVPEALRLAHLITGAVATGESGRRA